MSRDTRSQKVIVPGGKKRLEVVLTQHSLFPSGGVDIVFRPVPYLRILLYLCFLGGGSAFASGEPISSNPWARLEDEGGAWTSGWLAAQEQAEGPADAKKAPLENSDIENLSPNQRTH